MENEKDEIDDELIINRLTQASLDLLSLIDKVHASNVSLLL